MRILISMKQDLYIQALYMNVCMYKHLRVVHKCMHTHADRPMYGCMHVWRPFVHRLHCMLHCTMYMYRPIHCSQGLHLCSLNCTCMHTVFQDKANYTGYTINHPRISFKICLLMFKVMPASAPPYLPSFIPIKARTTPSFKRRLRSQEGSLQFGNWMFQVADPAEWNPQQEPVLTASSINTFKNKP